MKITEISHHLNVKKIHQDETDCEVSGVVDNYNLGHVETAKSIPNHTR